MPKGNAPRKTVLKTRRTASGAQQYVRGENNFERVKTAGDAVSATKSKRGKQLLLAAMMEEMRPKALTAYRAARQEDKKVYLAKGRRRSGK